MKRQVLAAMGLCLLTAGWAAAEFTSWGYRREVSLSTATATNNYQIRIDLTASNFGYAHAKVAGDDLRFEDPVTLQSLPYWIQTWTNAGTSTVWVAVPNAGTTNITMYYGNTEAAAASSGTNTFVFFDDFAGSSIDTGRWIIDNATGWTVAGGELKGANTTGRVRSILSFNSGVILESKSRRVGNPPQNGYMILGFYVSPANSVGFLNHPGNDYYRNDGSWPAIGATCPASVNLLSKIAAKSATQVDLTIVNFDTGASYQSNLNVANAVSSEQIALGFRFDGQNGGQAYEAYWDWIRVREYAATEPMASVGAEQITLLPGAPLIANVGAFNIDTNKADLVGNLSTGGAPVEVWCYWGTADGVKDFAQWATNSYLGVNALGYVTNNLTDLQESTRYYFRFYATNSAGDGWASSTTFFSTLGKPVVDNDGGATAVGQTSAQLRGTLQAGNPSPTVWIYWGTADGGTTPENWDKPVIAMGQPGLADFSASASGLEANRTYWYRCCASNDYGTVWAPASTNFTTASPSLVINDLGVLEGPDATTTDAVFTVTLSAVSAVGVSVEYSAADGTATVADSDYGATSGTLIVPAGNLTGQITVTVNGNNAYEANETFYVNLSNAVNVVIADSQGLCTITNDDWAVYVRGDGLGSDGNSGGSWSSAFATLNKALATVPAVPLTRDQMSLSVPMQIFVQASSGAQAFDVALRNQGVSLDMDFEGGWENVTSTPVQTGMSIVQDSDGTINEAGISLFGAYHGQWRRVVINRFAFTNVTRGVDITTGGGTDNADILLMVSNTTVYAKNDGIYVNYPKMYAPDAQGGLARVTAENVDIVAGAGGAGHGVYVYGAWLGSTISASGTNEITGEPRVSTITSTNGCGVYFAGINYARTLQASFSNTVIHGCSGQGIYVDALPLGEYYPGPSTIKAVLGNCTIVGNGSDGLRMSEIVASSGHSASIMNCILANNGSGHGVALGTNGPPTFACTESYNVFFNNDIFTNGASKVFAATTSAVDPVFYARQAKPDPWYKLASRSSPAYHSDSTGKNRGAYQTDKIPAATVIMLY